MTEAYALVCEAARRAIGMEPYDVQIAAALALGAGKLTEMQTGEGKTLAAALAVYWRALSGRGVHVATFNDYLARRDAERLGPLYRYLGLSVGCVQEGMGAAERRLAYAADVTYLTAKEGGFDYLRDGLCLTKGSLVQRPYHFIVVDEADSILIDEARTPLVLAGEADAPQRDGARLAAVVGKLAAGIDYETDGGRRNVYLTDQGAMKAEALLGCGNLYAAGNELLLGELRDALHARALLRRDVDYIVRAGRVELIDPLTGRIAERRRWPDGLQNAVEVKEGLQPQRSGEILASITLRHWVGLYPRLCGMTATASSSTDEFAEAYGLQVAVIPARRPAARTDYPLVVYATKAAKLAALTKEIAALHAAGRPVLIGTSSVAESNGLAAALAASGVSCNVLNAGNEEREAAVIGQAGAVGAVTVSTNMAGRGVDIRLGAGDEEQAAAAARLGGLAVIGAGLHESMRIDNQLRGRAGRQGDPGSSVFYVSLEDELFARYSSSGAAAAGSWRQGLDGKLEGAGIRRRIEHLQRVADGQNREIRQTLNRYADMLEQQRHIVADRRRGLLEGRIAPAPLVLRDPDGYADLCARYGAMAVKRAETEYALLALDRCWADHLEYASVVREGIHFESTGVRDPLDVYERLLLAAFADFFDKAEDRAVRALLAVDRTKPDIGPEPAAFNMPSATWTYLINDRLLPHRHSFW
ncbi:accessory Sec system translocase SecA2 [Paenibacillus hodogayensis]